MKISLKKDILDYFFSKLIRKIQVCRVKFEFLSSRSIKKKKKNYAIAMVGLLFFLSRSTNLILISNFKKEKVENTFCVCGVGLLYV